MTYKHRDIVIAYMEGKQIQRYNDILGWFDLNIMDQNTGIEYYFSPEIQYRIKPETKKYRVAQMKLNTMSINDIGTAQGIEHNPLFVRWLTDWVEYEA